MIEGEPSRTALGAALHRAVHQVVEGGRVFPDPVAVPITGWSTGELAERAAAHPGSRPLRLFIAMRHAFARDVVADAAASGTRQVVVLGAGLDTTAYQPQPAVPDLRVVEVDHPATQAWKLEALARAGIEPTVTVGYTGVDFETQSWLERLRDDGLDLAAPTVVVWLGVLPYLTGDAIAATLTSVAALGPGSQLVLDYGEPRGDAAASDLEARVDRAGEPFRTRLTPAQLAAVVQDSGLTLADDLGVAAAVQRYLGATIPDRPGGHLVRCRVPAAGDAPVRGAGPGGAR